MRRDAGMRQRPGGASSKLDVPDYYARYGPMVLRRCRKLLKDEEMAFDTMQEVFLKLLIYQHRLKPTHPSSLLYRMATNLCLNKIRDQRNHQLGNYLDIMQNVSFMENPEDVAVTKSLLHYILDGEKKSTHQMAVMYFIDGMTLKEISAIVGLSSSGVHKRLKKLCSRIRKKGGYQ